MKIIFLLFAFIILASSCGSRNSPGNTASGNSGSDGSGYAYTTEHPYEWEWGDKNNIKIAMNSLKAFEKGNISAALKDFADTVLVQMDGFEGRLSKDSLISLFMRERNAIKRMGIEMDDFESVRSKDGKSEYVSLWYKQLWEDQAGKIDSIECMDDVSFKNGKIVLLNEKVRRYPGGVE